MTVKIKFLKKLTIIDFIESLLLLQALIIGVPIITAAPEVPLDRNKNIDLQQLIPAGHSQNWDAHPPTLSCIQLHPPTCLSLVQIK